MVIYLMLTDYCATGYRKALAYSDSLLEPTLIFFFVTFLGLTMAKWEYVFFKFYSVPAWLRPTVMFVVSSFLTIYFFFAASRKSLVRVVPRAEFPATSVPSTPMICMLF